MKSQGKIGVKKTIVLGFALFAMFFGAGNLIFPPYLGLESGANWFPGFLTFMLIDAGLGVAAIIACMKSDNGMVGVTEKLGSGVSTLLMVLTALCLGPLVCIPRTAATTFELAVQPLLPDASSWIVSIIFFALVFVLSIRPSKIVDIIGYVLSPLMLVALGVLIIKGGITPLGTVGEGMGLANSVKMGLESGYQTMDMLGGILFSVVVLKSVKAQGYADRKSQTRASGWAGAVASLGLMLVYGGLAYLGASSYGTLGAELGQTGLLLAITNGVMGELGALLLGIIVAAACLTTAIGLTSSAAECLSGLSRGKLSYKALVVAICVVSCVIANLGISTIISLASPVLELIYPVMMTLVILSLMPERVNNVYVHRGAACMAFVTAALTLVDSFFPAHMGIDLMPLYGVGLHWLIPAAVGAICGGIFARIRVARSPKRNTAKHAI